MRRDAVVGCEGDSMRTMALRGHSMRYDAMEGRPELDKLAVYCTDAGRLLGTDYGGLMVDVRGAVEDGLSRRDTVLTALAQVIGDIEAALA